MTLSGMWWSLYTVNQSPNTQPTPSLPLAYSILNVCDENDIGSLKTIYGSL